MRVWIAVLAMVVGTGLANADDAADRGAVLALSCAACHGTDGQSPGAMPSLAGQESAWLAKQMLAFRSGARQGTVMGRLAKGYGDAEIQLLAEHFARLKGDQQ